MAMMDAKLLEVALKDPRYAYEAYDVHLKALDHAQACRVSGRPRKRPTRAPAERPVQHVKSRELLEGIRSLALQEFGLMAKPVFRMWGVEPPKILAASSSTW